MKQKHQFKLVQSSVFSKQIGRYTPSVPIAISLAIRFFLEQTDHALSLFTSIVPPSAYMPSLYFNASVFLWYCRYAYYPSNPECDITIHVPDDFAADNLDHYENIINHSFSAFC